MTLNDAFCIILDYLIKEASNKEFIEKLNIIKKGIEGFKHVEQERHPKFMSILLFGSNMFPFPDSAYISMAEIIKDTK